jgi:ectoine hydroxylase-related dioxygenase (phytanoyl-CoA dioxygenase family)
MTVDANSFDELGFCIIPDAVTAGVLDELARSVEAISANETAGRAPGTRNLAALAPSVAQFAGSSEISALLAALGLPGGFLVRSILFDKQPGTNWKVSWHQDVTISVCEELNVPGFGPWSKKAGAPHVQPPASILGRMITLRLHLDDCDAENGALRVIPGSHRHGTLAPEEIQRWRGEQREIVCAVPRRGILAMRPLLLHASSQALRPRHRRVIHLEYAMDDLPGGLKWFSRKNGTDENRAGISSN